MEQTTYYNLNLVTGTDLVNPLIQDRPNFETIDTVMHNNAISSVGTATELKSGSVHALTRNIATPCFKFTATSDFTLGDSFTVDGEVVAAVLPNGYSLPDKAYLVNSDLLCVLTGQHLTIFTVGTDDELKQEVADLSSDVEELQEKVDDIVIDQIYSATSANAQSGVAVAQAIQTAITTVINADY